MTPYRICRQISTRSTVATPEAKSKKINPLRTNVTTTAVMPAIRPPTQAAAMTAATIRM